MSRSCYTDDDDGTLGLYRANVDRALSGKRGQAFLSEMAKAMDEMPRKRLMPHVLVEGEGDETEMCAMGTVAIRRKLDVTTVDENDPGEVADLFGISRMMAAEIAYINDECAPYYQPERDANGYWVRAPEETPEQRWVRVRKWVREHLLSERTPEVVAGMLP